MNNLDIAVLFLSIGSISIYGILRTRQRDDLTSYIKGKEQTPWWAIGLSVMATQASAITFLSTPGQGYLNGLGFIQIYFGIPIALIIISAFFVPQFHKLNIFTAYEFLENRFDRKTRLLGAFLFLLQRGIGAGLTIYAPAIVLSVIFGWSLPATIIGCGLVATLYTVSGGTDAVTITQKYQLAVIFAGLLTATFILLSKLPADLHITDTLSIAGSFHKLNAVDFSIDPTDRYTFWSGILGGSFLMLSYFGADQSQVQRYLAGRSVRESRLGLLFNAVFKIPMQFFILFMGVLIFVFYQFQTPPLFFDAAAQKYVTSRQEGDNLKSLDRQYKTEQRHVKEALQTWLTAKKDGLSSTASRELNKASEASERAKSIKIKAVKELQIRDNSIKANDADYIFITFILKELPHGIIGLLVAAFILASLASKAAELNALGTTTTIDFYNLIFNDSNEGRASLFATRLFTALWGIVAIIIALFAHLSENLIQAVNILGSIFYGVLIALFLSAFFVKSIGGRAMFWSALITQSIVFYIYFNLSISYLWLPLIGCLICMIIGVLLEKTIPPTKKLVLEV